MKKIIFVFLSCAMFFACGNHQEKQVESIRIDTDALRQVVLSSLSPVVGESAQGANVLIMDVATGDLLFDCTVEQNGDSIMVPSNPKEKAIEPGALISTMVLASILNDPKMDLDTAMLVKVGSQYYGDGIWSVHDSRRPMSDSLPLREALAMNSLVCMTELGERYYSECHDRLMSRLVGMFPKGRVNDLKIGAPHNLKDYGILLVEGKEKAGKRLERVEYRRFYQLCNGYGIEVYPRDILAYYNSVAASKEKSAGILRDLLLDAVELGSASIVQTDAYSIAGKTATIANYDSPYLYTVCFAGFFPAEEPQFSCMITLYKSIAFGRDAALVFKKIADEIMLNIQH